MLKLAVKVIGCGATCLALWQFCQCPVYANSAFSDILMTSPSCHSIVVLILIVPIEAFFLQGITKSGWRAALIAASWINLGSVLAGLVLSILTPVYWLEGLGISIGLAIILTPLCLIFVKRYPLVLFGIVLFDIATLFMFKPELIGLLYAPERYYTMYNVPVLWKINYLMYFFGITLAIESLYARRFIKHPKLDLAVLYGNFVTYTILGFVLNLTFRLMYLW